MSVTTISKAISMNRMLAVTFAALALTGTAVTRAAAPGITGPNFNLVAQENYISQPDGQMVYSWGYGCNGAPAGFAPQVTGSTDPTGSLPGSKCSPMQVPGPTLIVHEGDTVTVRLTNGLPNAAGNTSILFPGFNVCAGTIDTTTKACTALTGVSGLLTQEAAPGGTVTYTFVASQPGTRAYYSGTQGDLQVEMGLYGAIIVLPTNVPTVCTTGLAHQNVLAKQHWGESDFRNATAAYDNPKTCYDREYLFQFSEMDPNVHKQALAQVTALRKCTAGSVGCSLEVPTEPYHPAYFMINGRSMPDDMDPNYAFQYPQQPYNGNPHMHPGEQVLLRIIGQGRWQHPFHEHGNHVRVLARDGNLILASNNTNETNLAGPLLFTTTTTPGLAMDGIFYWTAKGLNWDAYGHNPGSADANAKLPCTPDANGYNTGAPTAINYYEWCQDHNKPLQAKPFGDVAGNGPATLPDPNLFTNGAWFGGSPYLGPNATTRATFGGCTPGYPGPVTGSSPPIPGSCGGTGTTPPSGTIANPPASEAGFAFMWHSHNEREITTNNIFPGGMLMMMLVDSREFVIDESN
jgi:FtsP/CotA-like multicopper oxidase with cupredoxin domain